MTPRLSVLMPVRNGMPWLREALEGLGRQTFADFEIIALEDGSTDETPRVLAAWPDDRLRVISTGGVGMAAALTIGLTAARARLVARQDADDVSLPERFATQYAFLRERRDVGVVGCTAEYIDADGHEVDNDWVRTIRRQQDVALTPDQIRDLMPLTCCLTHGSVMARTDVLRTAGGYRRAAEPADDYDLWLRLLPETRIAKLPERLYQYRVHAQQVSATRREQMLLHALTAKYEYLRRQFPSLPSSARLMVLGAGRGAEYYRMLAPVHGFQAVPCALPLERNHLELLEQRAVRRRALDTCDALAITDFDHLDAYTRALTGDPENQDLVRIGNLFVNRRWASCEAA